jgi:hypothetical protein
LSSWFRGIVICGEQPIARAGLGVLFLDSVLFSLFGYTCLSKSARESEPSGCKPQTCGGYAFDQTATMEAAHGFLRASHENLLFVYRLFRLRLGTSYVTPGGS